MGIIGRCEKRNKRFFKNKKKNKIRIKDFFLLEIIRDIGLSRIYNKKIKFQDQACRNICSIFFIFNHIINLKKIEIRNKKSRKININF